MTWRIRNFVLKPVTELSAFSLYPAGNFSSTANEYEYCRKERKSYSFHKIATLFIPTVKKKRTFRP